MFEETIKLRDLRMGGALAGMTRTLNACKQNDNRQIYLTFYPCLALKKGLSVFFNVYLTRNVLAVCLYTTL